MLAADMPCPEVVESHDLVAQGRIDDLSYFAELLLGQCLVGEATPAVEQDPDARDTDRSGYDEADHGVDPIGAGQLDRNQGCEHPQRTNASVRRSAAFECSAADPVARPVRTR